MGNGIHCLVFSKDRAMQLDAFLRSAERYAPYQSVSVTYESGQSLQVVVADFLRGHSRVVFHTDDDVFFREPHLPWYRNAPDPAVISLRLGKNTTFCHPLAIEQEIPHFPWRWRDANGDFGYPLALNATVYESKDLVPLLNFPFENPTQLEAGLAYQHAQFKPEWMTAPLHSCCVSLPHNVVSESSNCPRGGNPDWQPDALNEMYIDGWRIDLDAMDFSNVIGAHQEIPLKFYKP